jgi:ABC-type Na+ efflux pump permease subunit
MSACGGWSTMTQSPSTREILMNKLYIYAGIAASCVMICIGIAAIAVGFEGRSTVRDELARENIVGTPDMKNVANEKIDTGQEARDFAAGMRLHTLADTKGLTYAEMPRFLDENGKPTADEKAAAIDPKSGEPVSNPARNIWVTETALATALNTSYFAENVATFATVMGFALLLAGIGFLVLTLRLPRRADDQAAASQASASRPALAS